MSDPLKTYLQDHLAGSRVAIDLLGSMRDQHEGEPLGEFAAELLGEVTEDRDLLRRLIGRMGSRRNWFKQATAWLGEKLARLKFHRRTGRGLGTLQALETLALGVQGKLSLWNALAAVAPADGRLYGFDFAELAARAQDQHARLEERRMEAARAVLAGSPAVMHAV